MDFKYWNKRWEENNIRFHQETYNDAMVKFFDDQNLENKTVLIPLAGKSLDILYFLNRGAKVIAVEFSRIAIKDFFQENKIEYVEEGNIFKGKNIDFYCHDFFTVEISLKVDFLYDRASVIALNENQRKNYYQKISQLITQSTTCFIIALDHEGTLEEGPPYKVPKLELDQAFSKLGITLSHFHTLSEGDDFKKHFNSFTWIAN